MQKEGQTKTQNEATCFLTHLQGLHVSGSQQGRNLVLGMKNKDPFLVLPTHPLSTYSLTHNPHCPGSLSVEVICTVTKIHMENVNRFI